MGILFQFVTNREISPVIYSHGGNDDAPSVLCRLRDQMEVVCGRGDEISFVAARCVQQLVRGDVGATGVRITNLSREMTIEDSIDGAEMFVIEIGDLWRVRQLFGYQDVTAYPTHPKIEWANDGPVPDIEPNL